MTQSETTEVAMQAQVEQVRPGEWRVRCGNPKCPSRRFGPPLQGASTICVLRLTDSPTAPMRCSRCGVYNDIEIG